MPMTIEKKKQLHRHVYTGNHKNCGFSSNNVFESRKFFYIIGTCCTIEVVKLNVIFYA